MFQTDKKSVLLCKKKKKNTSAALELLGILLMMEQFMQWGDSLPFTAAAEHGPIKRLKRLFMLSHHPVSIWPSVSAHHVRRDVHDTCQHVLSWAVNTAGHRDRFLHSDCSPRDPELWPATIQGKEFTKNKASRFKIPFKIAPRAAFSRLLPSY